MIKKGPNLNLSERHEEFLALINMIEYAVGISESLCTGTATRQLDAARKSLLEDIKRELDNQLSSQEIVQLAGTRVGHC